MKKQTNITFDKKIEEFNENMMINYSLGVTLTSLYYLAVTLITLLATYYILSEYVTKTICFTNYKLTYLMISLMSLAFGLCIVIQLIPLWRYTYNERKVLKEILYDPQLAQHWRNESLNEDNLGLFALMYAKKHNLLAEDEFEIKKKLFCESDRTVTWYDFRTIIEFRNVLNISESQFNRLKKLFLQNNISGGNAKQLKELNDLNVLSDDEVSHKIVELKNQYNRTIPKVVLLAILPGFCAGLLFFGLSCISAR